MTTDQIKAELRRSACEDDYPWSDMVEDAYWVVRDFREPGQVFYGASTQTRVFMLLVAEALE